MFVLSCFLALEQGYFHQFLKKMTTIRTRPRNNRLQALARLQRLQDRFSASIENKIALVLIIIALISGGATYAAMNSAPPFGDNPDAVIWLLYLDLVILVALMILIARRVVSLFTVWRKGIPGARLHIRLVYIFGLLAMTPAVFMTVFSLFFFHYGVQAWFSERVKSAVTESQAVAEAYLEEHQQVIRADIMAMASDLDREASLQVINPKAFKRFLETQSLIRNLSEVTIFDQTGPLMQVGLVIGFNVQDIPQDALARATGGDVVVIADPEDDRVRALVKLNNFSGSYLYVGRMVEPNVLNHLATTRNAVQRYSEIEARYSSLRTSVTMIFVVVALLLVFASIWFGLLFARSIATPITNLIVASERVRAGDLTSRLDEQTGLDEFDYLARSFNRMTGQILEQRDELVQANRQLDHRRRFTETILAGVSSGVVSVDRTGKITLANNSATQILRQDEKNLTGTHIKNILPEAEESLVQAYLRPNRMHQSEIPYVLPDGSRLTLFLRIAIELVGDDDHGAVITFDDITDLQSAQRKAAWADVARRIAHEIKNPLTPIQLSAERLKRKYLKTIPEAEQGIFSQCIDTIIRHVGDIGHMVTEFSSFARMPEPKMDNHNLDRIIRDIVALQQEAHANITFTSMGLLNDNISLPVYCDEQQIRQALVNIIQNAVDSVQQKSRSESDAPAKIAVGVDLQDDGTYILAVHDSGFGLPKDKDLSTLTEPYVTFRERGTGLGLAIVKKIMEDHKGRILFTAADKVRLMKNFEEYGGATVVLTLPATQVSVDNGLSPNTQTHKHSSTAA